MRIGIRIRGLVQGVGFRPTVWRIANQLGLAGDVRNDGDGVWIRLNANPQQAETFIRQIRQQLPQLARIDEINLCDLDENIPATGFVIHPSENSTPLTGIAPDAATCPECLQELNDPDNRRYRYPFINCTRCGPRLSIIHAIPYDRVNTSMGEFTLCKDCRREYLDPNDRRYHAQPNACPVCGPHIWLDQPENRQDVIQQAQNLLRTGKILALKGIGGFHLACDAHDTQAVDALRRRKQRYAKAFALMARDLDVIRTYCDVSPLEESLLSSWQAPIVLLDRKPNAPDLPYSVALDHQTLGFMLPYSPLHHLLLQDWNTPLVMTSGNLSDEPQCTTNEAAANKLNKIADHQLMHNRDIVHRIDDSVVRVIANQPSLYRRARGYAPAPIKLHTSFKLCPPILALGTERKNTFCLLRQGNATVSQHIGDLSNPQTYDEYAHTIAAYQHLFDFQPAGIAIDQHPNYTNAQMGACLAEQNQVPLTKVQHHHAHIASVLAEHGFSIDCPPVLGVALDGLGFGDDGTLWGGEWLIANFKQYTRKARFKPIPMPGGVQAIKEPWRNLYAQLAQYNLWPEIKQNFGHLDSIRYINNKPLEILETMLARGINSPYSSSAGRLFDAVAAALSVHHDKAYQEGQAAIALEHLAMQAGRKNELGMYTMSFDIKDELYELNLKAFWQALFEDTNHLSNHQIALKFHLSLAHTLAQFSLRLCRENAMDTVVLSGGVWQNRVLTGAVIQQLESKQLKVLMNRQVPSNDGGVSLGQAAIAAARMADARGLSLLPALV